MSKIDPSKVLLPGEAQFTDEELKLMQSLLDTHLDLARDLLQKVRHIRGEDQCSTS